MKELVIITASPANVRFAWEHYVYLNNLREKQLSDKAEILVFVPNSKLKEGPHPMWKHLEETFPETKFFYFYDRPEYIRSIERLWGIFDYIPLLRPYCLIEHFRSRPELKDKAIFYTDSDILLTEHFNFEPFLHDDICYVSDAKSYTNATYFDSKYEIENNEQSPLYGQPKWVRPEKYEGIQKRDVLNECAKICGITRQIVEENNNTSGAAQYLLKNIDYHYWNDVFNACIELRSHLAGINQEYMRGDLPIDRENNGWQSWCADIWAVTWNLLKRGYTIKTPKEFDFAWATDEISKLKLVAFYHNAGVTSDAKLTRRSQNFEIDCPAFFKGDSCFISENAITPFSPEYQPILDNIVNNPTSQLFCNGYYAKELKRVRDIYNLK